MIPLFVGYAMIIWVGAARHRRQLLGFLIVLAGLLGLVGLNMLHSMLNVWTGGSIHLPVLRAIMYPYTGFVAAIGVFIAALPRRSGLGCFRCAYDLEGLEPIDGGLVCPECGQDNARPEVYRRSGTDRPDPGASDRPTAPPATSPTREPPGRADREDQRRNPADQPPTKRAQHAH